MIISWLEALKNLGIETTKEVEIATGASPSISELSESLTQQDDKSAKRKEEGLLSLLAPLHIRNPESHALRQGCREKDISTQGRPWLDALRSSERTLNEEEKRTTRVLLSSADKPSEPLPQRGAKSVKSPAPSPDREVASGNTPDAKPKEARRTLVTTQDQLAAVIADVNLVTVDLETTGLDPRRVVLCPRCDRCDAEAATFGHWSELCERYAVELRACRC
jgi:hypothetical protein